MKIDEELKEWDKIGAKDVLVKAYKLDQQIRKLVTNSDLPTALIISILESIKFSILYDIRSIVYLQALQYFEKKGMVENKENRR